MEDAAGRDGLVRLGRRPQQTQIEGFGIAMAAVTILALPSLLVFLALQRHFVEGVAKTGLKG